MIQNIIKKNESVTPVSKEMEGLREYFPQCFNNEGRFDIEKFREAIEPMVDVTREGRSYDFLGKSYARMLSSLDTTTVIRPDVEHNSKPDNANSENIYISGDNLDALHHLVKSYAGQVKCIYIDPPYNTGTDGFVYNDKFKFTAEELTQKLSISPDEAEKIIAMTSGHRASHAAWLTFMMPRLQLARDLLSRDGVIFISIDDNEQAYLKTLCDFIYGEDNCLGCIVRPTGQTTGQDSGGLGSSFDYILAYSRVPDYELNGLELTERDKKRFENEDDVGRYAYDQLRKTGSNDKREDRPRMFYPVKDPDGNDVYPIAGAGYESRWRVEKSTYDNLVKNNFILWKKTNRNEKEVWWPYVKYYLDGRTKRPSPLWMDLEGNKKAARELRDLFDGHKVFDFPKPVDLIKRVIQISTEDDSIIVDFFGGSSTTAQAIMEFNQENDSNCKFIIVQWQEQLEETSEACKFFGYRTIDQIGMERIKRAAKKIKDENPLFAGDLGFKHYTLEEVPQNTLDKLETFDPNAILSTDDVLNMFGRDTVLATWLVNDGYGLGAKTEDIVLDKYHATRCGNHLYMVDADFTEDAMTALVDRYQSDPAFNPDCIVLFGYSFSHNAKDILEKNKPTINLVKDKNIIIDVRY